MNLIRRNKDVSIENFILTARASTHLFGIIRKIVVIIVGGKNMHEREIVVIIVGGKNMHEREMRYLGE